MTASDHRDLVGKWLGESTTYLYKFLGVVLPEANSEWRERLVKDKLSEQQQQHITYRNFTSLRELDLAALLRIFDRNWDQISYLRRISFESRNYLKEMMSIRDRWARLGSEPIRTEDVYRDLDTISRFAITIDADASFVAQVNADKIELLGEIAVRPSTSSASRTDASTVNLDAARMPRQGPAMASVEVEQLRARCCHVPVRHRALE